MNSPRTTKFRPYFTPDELSYLITLCKQAIPPNESMIRYLESFALKIKHGVIDPQITLKGSKIDQLREALDLEGQEAYRKQSLLEYQSRSYVKWQSDPESCTPGELTAAHAFRIANGLLSTEEEFKLNQSLMENFK